MLFIIELVRWSTEIFIRTYVIMMEAILTLCWQHEHDYCFCCYFLLATAAVAIVGIHYSASRPNDDRSSCTMLQKFYAYNCTSFQYKWIINCFRFCWFFMHFLIMVCVYVLCLSDLLNEYYTLSLVFPLYLSLSLLNALFLLLSLLSLAFAYSLPLRWLLVISVLTSIALVR